MYSFQIKRKWNLWKVVFKQPISFELQLTDTLVQFELIYHKFYVECVTEKSKSESVFQIKTVCFKKISWWLNVSSDLDPQIISSLHLETIKFWGTTWTGRKCITAKHEKQFRTTHPEGRTGAWSAALRGATHVLFLGWSHQHIVQMGL